jgi:hypothetical protein
MFKNIKMLFQLLRLVFRTKILIRKRFNGAVSTAEVM